MRRWFAAFCLALLVPTLSADARVTLPYSNPFGRGYADIVDKTYSAPFSMVFPWERETEWNSKALRYFFPELKIFTFATVHYSEQCEKFHWFGNTEAFKKTRGLEKSHAQNKDKAYLESKRFSAKLKDISNQYYSDRRWINDLNERIFQNNPDDSRILLNSEASRFTGRIALSFGKKHLRARSITNDFPIASNKFSITACRQPLDNITQRYNAYYENEYRIILSMPESILSAGGFRKRKKSKRSQNSRDRLCTGTRSERGTIDDVMAAADVVVTTTPAQTPLISGHQLRAGQHITAMGTDADYKTELAVDVIPAADRYVCDNLAQCLKQGELRPAVAAGTIAADTIFPELGQIIAGLAPGRQNDKEITICDLTGTGVQDTAIATFAYERAVVNGTGRVVSN